MAAGYLVDGEAPHRLAILRGLPGLGDFLCAVPAWRALRAALPRANITLVGVPEAGSMVERFHAYLDELLPLPGYPGLPEGAGQPTEVASFLLEAQARLFDLVLQMQGNGLLTNTLAVLLGGRATAGFYLPGQFCPDGERFLPYPSEQPEVLRHLSLMEHLDIRPAGSELEFPLQEADLEEGAAVRNEFELGEGEYVMLHPGATAPARRWAPSSFAAIADRLGQSGLRVVLTGVEAELPLTTRVAQAMKAKPVNLAGRTSMGGMAALLTGARLLIGNDTGVSHLSAALRIPSVIVFAGSRATGSDPARWAPLDGRRHRAVFDPRGQAESVCQNGHGGAAGAAQGERLPSAALEKCWASERCLRDACSLPDRSATAPRTHIGVEQVWQEVDSLLQSNLP